MKHWLENIEDVTNQNQTFRTVLFTGEHSQLTVMSLKAGEEIGNEVHPSNDQFIRFEQGSAKITLGPDENTIEDELSAEEDFAVIIPAGTWHNIVNAGDGELKLYSIYSPAEHADGTVHQTKAEADAAEAADHGA